MSNRKYASQKIYRVSISKTFDYPSSVIDEGNRLRDLHEKSITDFFEKARSGKLTVEDFTCKLEVELPFKVRTKEDQTTKENSEDKFNLDNIIRELATYDVEQQVGKLDPNINPDLFTFVDEEWDEPEDEDGEPELVRAAEEPYLKPEYENKIFEREIHYRKALKNIVQLL